MMIRHLFQTKQGPDFWSHFQISLWQTGLEDWLSFKKHLLCVFSVRFLFGFHLFIERGFSYCYLDRVKWLQIFGDFVTFFLHFQHDLSCFEPGNNLSTSFLAYFGCVNSISGFFEYFSSLSGPWNAVPGLSELLSIVLFFCSTCSWNWSASASSEQSNWYVMFSLTLLRIYFAQS